METEEKVVSADSADEETPQRKSFHGTPHRRVSIRICKDCGRTYILSDKDATYFVSKYATLPLRCEECRKKAKGSEPDPETTE